MAREVTKRQQVVLDGLAAKKTPDEIAKQMGISVNGVYGHIRRLKKAGLLSANGKKRGRPRGSARKSRPRASRNSRRNVGVETPVIRKMLDARADVEKRRAAIRDERAKLDAEDLALEAALND